MNELEVIPACDAHKGTSEVLLGGSKLHTLSFFDLLADLSSMVSAGELRKKGSEKGHHRAEKKGSVVPSPPVAYNPSSTSESTASSSPSSSLSICFWRFTCVCQ